MLSMKLDEMYLDYDINCLSVEAMGKHQNRKKRNRDASDEHLTELRYEDSQDKYILRFI